MVPYGFVYMVICQPTDRLYIGQTIKLSVEERWRKHCYDAKRTDRRIPPLHQDILRYGRESFDITELQRCYCRDEMDEAEVRLIAQYNTKLPFGYNANCGGRGRR